MVHCSHLEPGLVLWGDPLPNVGEPATIRVWAPGGPPAAKKARLLDMASIVALCHWEWIEGAPDFRFWQEAVRFFVNLIVREQFLPSIEYEPPHYHARWKPFLNPHSQEIMMVLAAAMPDAARAATAANAKHAPSTPPLQVLNALLRRVADHLPRQAVARGAVTEGANVHDLWLACLHTQNGAMRSQPWQVAHFASTLLDWQQPLGSRAEFPYHLCLRVEEADESKPWFVHFLMKSSKDGAADVTAREIWGSEPISAAADIAVLRERLMLSLGQAARVWPRIGDAMRAPSPSGVALENGEVFFFLQKASLLLAEAGFSVETPLWWTRPEFASKLTARARVSAKTGRAPASLSLQDLVQFDWEVALGGEIISRAELKKFAESALPFVKLKGKWVHLDPSQVREALELWKDQPSGETRLRDVMRLALGGGAGARKICFAGVEAQGWFKKLLDQLNGNTAFEEIAPPSGFNGTLRPYQVRGYSWLGFLRRWGLGACLADDMGLGKTIQALALIVRDWDGGQREPVLLVCPTSVVGNWKKEADRFAPGLPVVVHHGLGRAKGEKFHDEISGKALVISSYSLLHRDIEQLREVRWGGVVLDEAQNIKNHDTRQAHAARELSGGYKIAMTGTPVENHVGELWSIMNFLNPGLLGGAAEFRKQFLLPIQSGADKAVVERLRKLTGPFILRRLKSDKSVIADLPDKLEMKVYCNLTKEQAALYDSVVQEALHSVDRETGMRRKAAVLSMLLRLKQICNHPAQYLRDGSKLDGRSGKLSRLTEMLEEVLEINEKALIFSQFAEMAKLLEEHLSSAFPSRTLRLDGSVPAKQRQQMVEAFESTSADSPKLFVLSLKAGGTGINLTAANHVFHFDRWWNPAVENQATDRAYRIGQLKNVQVHKFICTGTLEETIDEMIERKRSVAEDVIGAGESWLTELSTTELRDILMLRKDAVGE